MRCVKVKVEKLHIDVGSFCNAGSCAVALAIDDALGYGGLEDRRAVEVAHEGEIEPNGVPNYLVWQRGVDFKRSDRIRTISKLSEEVCEWIYAGDLDNETHGHAYAAERRHPIEFVMALLVEPL